MCVCVECIGGCGGRWKGAYHGGGEDGLVGVGGVRLERLVARLHLESTVWVHRIFTAQKVDVLTPKSVEHYILALFS